MVVDTSALLAIVFDEPTAAWVADQMMENALTLRMSTVNYSEALILASDRRPEMEQALARDLQDSPIKLVVPSAGQAEIAARARIEFPLNLGDCFAYALAKSESWPILTLDRDFLKTDLDVVSP